MEAQNVLHDPNRRSGYGNCKSKSLEDICTCPACLMLFAPSEPKSLIPRSLTTCGHTICTGCIEVWMVRGRGPHIQKDEVSCPMCRQLTKVPNGGDVTELPANWTLIELLDVLPEPKKQSVTEPPIFCNMGCDEKPVAYHCKECQEYMCQFCAESSSCRSSERDGLHRLCLVHPPKPPRTWDHILLNPPQSNEICPIHTGMKLNLVCPKRQNELICLVCKDMVEHRDHDHIPLTTLAERKHESVHETLCKLKWRMRHMQRGFNICHRTHEELEEEKDKMFTDIDTVFKRLEDALYTRREALKGRIREAVQYKSQILKHQADNLSQNVVDAKKICGALERLNRSTDFEMVMLADELLEEGQQLLGACQSFDPAFSPNITFQQTGVDGIITHIDTFGELSHAPGPVEGADVSMSDVGNKVEARLMWGPPVVSWCAGPADHYVVQSRTVSDDEQQDRNTFYEEVYTGPLEGFTLHNVLKGVDHVFRIAAVNAAGTGPFVTTKPIRMDAPLFTWDVKKRHPAVRVSNEGYTASVGESARWISIGGSKVLESGQHYWEISLDRYGITSPTKKIVAGIVSAKMDPSRWQRGRSIIGLYSSSFNVPSWSLAVQTGKKLSHNTSSSGKYYCQRYLFQERDRLGILVDLDKQTLEYFRNGYSLGVAFEDVKGPVIPALSFCHHKRVSLHFPPIPNSHTQLSRPHIARYTSDIGANRTLRKSSAHEHPDLISSAAVYNELLHSS